MNRLIYRMGALKYWQIFALGTVTWLLSMAAVTLLAQASYGMFPEAWGAVALGHILVAGLAGWFIPKPFLSAWWVHLHTEIKRPRLNVFEEKK